VLLSANFMADGHQEKLYFLRGRYLEIVTLPLSGFADCTHLWLVQVAHVLPCAPPQSSSFPQRLPQMFVTVWHVWEYAQMGHDAEHSRELLHELPHVEHVLSIHSGQLPPHDERSSHSTPQILVSRWHSPSEAQMPHSPSHGNVLLHSTPQFGFTMVAVIAYANFVPILPVTYTSPTIPAVLPAVTVTVAVWGVTGGPALAVQFVKTYVVADPFV